MYIPVFSLLDLSGLAASSLQGNSTPQIPDLHLAQHPMANHAAPIANHAAGGSAGASGHNVWNQNHAPFHGNPHAAPPHGHATGNYNPHGAHGAQNSHVAFHSASGSHGHGPSHQGHNQSNGFGFGHAFGNQAHGASGQNSSFPHQGSHSFSGSGHGGSAHGGSAHGGSAHGGSAHGGSAHGGSAHGGSAHAGHPQGSHNTTGAHANPAHGPQHAGSQQPGGASASAAHGPQQAGSQQPQSVTEQPSTSAATTGQNTATDQPSNPIEAVIAASGGDSNAAVESTPSTQGASQEHVLFHGASSGSSGTGCHHYAYDWNSWGDAPSRNHFSTNANLHHHQLEQLAPVPVGPAQDPAKNAKEGRNGSTTNGESVKHDGETKVQPSPGHLTMVGYALAFGAVQALCEATSRLPDLDGFENLEQNFKDSSCAAADSVTPLGGQILRQHLQA